MFLGSVFGTTLIALIVYGLRIYIKKVTQNYFDKNIENHRHELTKTLKEIEFDYQRKIEDFSLYTQKRHSIYAELYQKLNQAVMDIKTATASFRTYPFPEVPKPDKSDLKKVLEKEGFDDEQIINVINKWQVGSLEGRNEATRLFDAKRLKKADQSRVEANQYFLKSELYLNEELSCLIDEALKIIFHMCIDESSSIEYPGSEAAKEKWKNHKENSEILEKKIIEIKKQMRKELSIGDYSHT
ncbi:hypothetical protein [Tenuibacillus multivorans]|nr:hypothetical protein [Tenuibacillus multivorans]